MPFALTLIGLLLIITGFQNTYKAFGAQVVGDFSGNGNFFYWILSLGAIGSLGYIKGFEGFSRAFMALVIIVMVIGLYKKNPNIFKDLQTGVNTGSNTPVNPIGAPLAASSGGSGGGSGGNSGGGLDIGSVASTALSVASFF
jgi:hypothetical protein